MKLFAIILFLLFFSFSIEISDKYNRANYNIVCSNKKDGCIFNVSSNYPISPKIPTIIPTHAILGDYRYIYLLFDLPKNQKQKTFYLEAYDTSNGETIISNGDCYLINITENTDYEIQIFKELKNNSFVQFRFLDLPRNFTMKIKLLFKLSISLYFHDIALSYSNSLNKTDQNSLVKYLEELNNKLAKQKERQTKAKETIKTIARNLFSTDININLFDDNFINSITFSLDPCFLITISDAVGLDLSTEKIFQPEDSITSELLVINGKTSLNSEGIDLFDGKLNLDSNFIKLLDSYINKIMEIKFELGIETDTYSMIVSTDFKSLLLTLTFYYENTKTINYEIEIKIEFINKACYNTALEKATVVEESFMNEELNYFALGVGIGAGGYIISHIILTMACPPAEALYLGATSAACLLPFISIFPKTNNSTDNSFR